MYSTPILALKFVGNVSHIMVGSLFHLFPSPKIIIPGVTKLCGQGSFEGEGKCFNMASQNQWLLAVHEEMSEKHGKINQQIPKIGKTNQQITY